MQIRVYLKNSKLNSTSQHDWLPINFFPVNIEIRPSIHSDVRAKTLNAILMRTKNGISFENSIMCIVANVTVVKFLIIK